MKEKNKSLFRKLKDSDSFLLGQAVKLGIVKDRDRELVRALRTVRNFCAHFNPYEVTVSLYRTALHRLGITDQPSLREIEQVAKATVEKAASILWSCKQLSEPKAKPRLPQHGQTYSKSHITRID